MNCPKCRGAAMIPGRLLIVASTETEDEWYARRRPKFVGPVGGPTTVPDDYASNRAVERLIRDQVKDKKSWQYGL